MKNLNSKIFVSYNGGSGGDFFTNCCNGIDLAFVPTKTVVKGSQSLKPFEYQINKDISTLPNFIDQLNPGYISTHLLEPLVESYKVINVIIKDIKTIESAIQRQMMYQQLKIDINPKENWYQIISAWCLAGKFDKAAIFWYEKANQRWKDFMKQRIKYQNITTLNFDNLFSEVFVNDLINQGWNHNINILKKNHELWLIKNKEFSKEATIESMSKKLAKMDWQQSSGTIIYSINKDNN